LGEVAIPPRSRSSPSSEVEAKSEPWGRARRSPSSEVEVESEPWGRARQSPSSEAEAMSEPWGRARRSPSSSVEVESEPWVGRGGDRRLPEPRLSSSPGVGRGGVHRLPEPRLSPSPRVGRGEVHLPRPRRGAEPWGRVRRSFLCRPRLDLAALSLTLSSGTAVRAGQATLYSCQVGQWSGEVIAVTSALSTEERASG
jgi:hypothetical protein